MSGNMSVSMTLRLLDQVSGPVRGIVEELRKLDKVSTEIGRNPSGDARAWQSETSAVRGVIAQLGELRAATMQSGATSSIDATIGRLNAERSSIQGVTAQFGALRTAAVEATAPIDGAIAKLNAEKAGIEGVTAAMRQLGTASVQARSSGRKPGDAPNWGPRWDEEGGSGPARSRSREGWARASDAAEAKPETPHPPIAAASSGGILDGMIGFGEMGTGYRLAKGSYEQGAEARSLDTGMKAAGYSDADVAQINTLAAELSRQSKVFSANTIVGLARDARTILGSTEHAAEAMPTILQLATIVEAKRPGHGEEGVAELLRGMEASGSTTSMEAFSQQANSIAKVMNVFGKTIGLDSFARFFIKAGTATPHLSNEFIEQKLPHLLQVMGGEQTGTMIQSIMRGTIAGRMDKDARETMQDYGLIDPSKVDEKGHMMPGAFLHGDVLARDPSEYATRYLKPALDARNLSEDEEEAVLGKMFSNRNVARGMSILINQDPIIQKDAAQIRSARGLDAAPMLVAGDPRLATTSIGAQVANFERQAGSTLIPALTKLQSGLATGIGTINEVLARVPGASTAAAGAIATGIGYLGWKTAQQGIVRGMGLIGSGGAAGEGAAAGAAATGMSEGTAVAIGSAAGTTAAALAMTAAGVAVMGGTVYGLRQIGPSGLSRGRSEPPSQQDTDLPGHWASGRFGLRQWALDQPGASPPQPVQPGLSTAEVQAIVAPLASAMAQAMSGVGPHAEFRAQPMPFGPARLDGAATTNQNTVNQTINAAITINATVNNSTPQAVGAAAASAVRRVVQRASTAVLHDGYETK